MGRSQHEPVDEDAGSVDGVGVQFPHLDDLLHFGDADLAAGGGHGVEVAGGLPVDEVAQAVRLPGLHQGEVREDALLQHALPPVEPPGLLPFSHLRAGARGREEGRNASAAGPHALCQGALGHQLHLQLAAEELACEFGVFAHVAADHLVDLAVPEEDAQAEVIHAGVVGIAGQALDAGLGQGADEVLGNAAEPETTYGEVGPVRNVLHGFEGGADALVDHGNLGTAQQCAISGILLQSLFEPGGDPLEASCVPGSRRHPQ